MNKAREYYYWWEWKLKADPQTLWPLVTDTNRFNRDTGLPTVERRNTPDQPSVNARRRLKFYRLGIPVEWEEEPFEWVQPFHFGVARYYKSGPVAEMRTLTELVPQPDGSTSVIYQVWAKPRNWLGFIAIPGQIGILSRFLFGRALHRYDGLALKHTPTVEMPGEVNFAPGGQQRLKSLKETLLAEGAQPEIIEHLTEAVEKTDDFSLNRMRPYELADHWDLPRRAVLEHFLLATRRGLLEMQWDVICPLCRNPNQVTKSLGGLKEQEHCPTCHIDFEVNF